MTTISSDKQDNKMSRWRLVVICVVLFFLALCWGIWWFFDYKIRTAQTSITAVAMVTTAKK